MTSTLLAQRCFHHPSREAVARCPECGRFFCRECITEHDDRVICASCLRTTTQKVGVRRSWATVLVRPLQLFLSFLLVWMFFYFAGRMLLRIPASFHEGTLWAEPSS